MWRGAIIVGLGKRVGGEGSDRSRDRGVEARLGSPPRRGPRGPISHIGGIMGNVLSKFHIRNIRSSSPDMPSAPRRGTPRLSSACSSA